jgi:hypothetical protein
MKISIDSAKYDEHQLFFVRKLCEMVRGDLQRAGIDDETSEELTTQVVFTMCCLADGSTILEFDGKSFLPCLTFSQGDDYSELLSAGGGSWMHEYVAGTVDDVFHEEDE